MRRLAGLGDNSGLQLQFEDNLHLASVASDKAAQTNNWREAQMFYDQAYRINNDILMSDPTAGADNSARLSQILAKFPAAIGQSPVSLNAPVAAAPSAPASPSLLDQALKKISDQSFWSSVGNTVNAALQKPQAKPVAVQSAGIATSTKVLIGLGVVAAVATLVAIAKRNRS